MKKKERKLPQQTACIKPCIGPTYTPEEERRIDRAISQAIAFMENYGKGSNDRHHKSDCNG